ncbi:MAG: ABC-2 family transporter protein [Candidatus Dojkabacteria bacterium]|jgi:ABC-2 type transport system permease protein|nr:ABC-2 family transporter protein [Candidatus Dojkabacteria bacterium]
MKQLIKILKIQIVLIKMNFQAMLVYRSNALLISLGSALYNIGAILFITFLFDKIPMLAGWDKWDLIFLYGISQVFAYLYFFSIYSNTGTFQKLIQSGNFDFVLTKPFSSLLFSTLQSYSFNELMSLIQPAAIVFYALSNKTYGFDLLGIFVAFLSILIALVIAHQIIVLTLIPTFWTIENSFYRLFSETSNISSYPYEIFDTKLTKFIFFLVIPYALIINIPFRALIGELDYKLFGLEILVCSGLLVVTNMLWKWGIKNYSSASS